MSYNISMPYEFSHFFPTLYKMSTHLTPRYLQKIYEITANEQFCLFQWATTPGSTQWVTLISTIGPSCINQQNTISLSNEPPEPSFISLKKDWKRRQGKGRRVCLWGQNLINSLPRYLFSLGRFEINGWIETFLPNRPAVFNRFCQIDRGKTACAARNWTNSAPKQTRRPLPYLLS